jgi:hypothetical protein
MDFTFVPVSAFVQADSQQPNPQANGVFVGNVGAGLLAWAAPIGQITSGAITAQIGNPQVVTLTAVTGTYLGVNWVLAVGQTLVIEPNTPNQEATVITSVNTATNQVQCVIRRNHTPVVGANGQFGITAAAYFLDQARSSMDPDGGSPQGAAQVQLAAIDPVTGHLAGARAATADGQPAANASVASQGLINLFGTVDRLRTVGAGRLDTSDQDILAAILIELRTITMVLVEGLSTQTDPDDYRSAVSVDYPVN